LEYIAEKKDNVFDKISFDLSQIDLGIYFKDKYNQISKMDSDIKKDYLTALIKTFRENKYSVSTNLIEKYQIEYDCRNNVNVVSGKNLIRKFLSNDFQNTLFIIDPIAFSNLKDYYSDELIVDPKHIKYINDLITGEDLKRVFHYIQENSIELLVGIGGGRTADLLKFISYETGLPCIAIPTSLASHVYASPKIHALSPIREFGYKLTIDGSASDLALLDISYLDYVFKSNKRLIMAGFGDLMAFWTALEDWKLACNHNKNKFDLFVLEVIKDIFTMFESIDVEKQFNKWVRDYILIQNLLCHITDWVGSAPASGSEHLFAHTIEKYHQDSVPIHGELVALGVIIFSSLHSLNQKNIIKLLDKFSIPRSLSEIGVTKENVVNALMDSKQYGNIKSRYTIVEELNYNRKDWELLISSLIEDKYILI